MTTLDPAPATLGLASPVIGPWFVNENDATATGPTLALPNADLAIELSLGPDIAFHAPAGGLVSWHVATTPRSGLLAPLRKANGEAAFTAGSLVVLHSLLPEVAARLGTLSNPIARADGESAPADGRASRPPAATFALEITSATADALALFNHRFPASLASDKDKAKFLGLTLSGDQLASATATASALARPATDGAVILKPSGTRAIRLWAFDTRGRALDPGAVARLWQAMAADEYDNLWATEDDDLQRTATTSPGHVVALVSAHEGPLSSALTGRLSTTGLTPIGASGTLFVADDTPQVTLTPASDTNTDSAPLPRLATLPEGSYAALDSATPFAGWSDAAFPLDRDFLRAALIEVEGHLTGLSRADDAIQQHPHTRITAHANDVGRPFLPDTDTVATEVLDLLADGDAEFMAPVIDADWGAQTPAALADVAAAALGDLPAPAFTTHALAGEGSESGDTVSEQIVALHFDGTLPAQTWVRVYTTTISGETGRRVRATGGAALADASGSALVVLPLPDGTKGAADDSVTLSVDTLIVAKNASRFFADQTLIRPPTRAGARVALPNDVSAALDFALYVPELGKAITRGGGELAAGCELVAVTGAMADGNLARVDPDTILPADRTSRSLPNAAQAGDLLITTEPAFARTPAGSLSDTGSAARLHRERNGVNELFTFGRPVPTQERLESVARDRADAQAVIGATPARAAWHEAAPARLGHPGVSAADEIHGSGARLQGPAADALDFALSARAAGDLAAFLQRVATPLPAATPPTGPTGWAAILETLTDNSASDPVFRALAGQRPRPGPGQDWNAIKEKIDVAIDDVNSTAGLSIPDVHTLLGDVGIAEDRAAAAVDRMIEVTDRGQAGLLASLRAAISRAEDLIWLQTPAIDPLPTGEGPAMVDILGDILDRIDERPGLSVILCVSEGWLPDRPGKLDEVRVAAIKAALYRLRDHAPDNVVLFTPVAGPGRKLHMATSTAVIDDVVLFTGTTHFWRRGLSFDSSLAAALFDDRLSAGRPEAIASARRLLMARMLGLEINLVPMEGAECLDAIRALNRAGGLGRVNPKAYPASPDSTPTADQDVWNPDGRIATDWYALYGVLAGEDVIN